VEGIEHLKRPYTIIFSTMTIDGRIASKTGYSQLSCPRDLMRLHRLRLETGAVMVGAETVIKDDPSLRLKYFKGEDPYKIIIDGLLRSPLNSRVFTMNPRKAILVTSYKADENKINSLRGMGVNIVQLNGPMFSLKEALEKLYDFGIKKLLVEGGGKLNWNMIKEGLVDEIRITIAPYIFGSGRSVFDGEGFETKEDGPKMVLEKFEICDCKNEVQLVYKFLK